MNIAQLVTSITESFQLIPEMSGGIIQNFDNLSEGLNDIPLLQIYPEEGVPNTGGSTERTTFYAGVRQERVTINLDMYARQRSQLGEDLATAIYYLDIIRAHLLAQKHKPFFGNDDIQSFNWRWERSTFEYNNLKYVGFRIILTVVVY